MSNNPSSLFSAKKIPPPIPPNKIEAMREQEDKWKEWNERKFEILGIFVELESRGIELVPTSVITRKIKVPRKHDAKGVPESDDKFLERKGNMAYRYLSYYAGEGKVQRDGKELPNEYAGRPLVERVKNDDGLPLRLRLTDSIGERKRGKPQAIWRLTERGNKRYFHLKSKKDSGIPLHMKVDISQQRSE